MENLSPGLIAICVAAAMLMVGTLCRSVSVSSAVFASGLVDQRRAEDSRKRAAAEREANEAADD